MASSLLKNRVVKDKYLERIASLTPPRTKNSTSKNDFDKEEKTRRCWDDDLDYLDSTVEDFDYEPEDESQNDSDFDSEIYYRGKY
jgi:hypothetical protein